MEELDAKKTSTHRTWLAKMKLKIKEEEKTKYEVRKQNSISTLPKSTVDELKSKKQ